MNETKLIRTALLLIFVGSSVCFAGLAYDKRTLESIAAEAAQKGDCQAIIKLLPNIDIDGRGHGEDTLLVAACKAGQLSVVKMLVEKGARVNPEWGTTPLMGAAEHGYLDIAQFLLESGADIKIKRGKTALAWAAKNGHLAIVQMILDNCKACVDSTDGSFGSGKTPLLHAVKNRHLAVARLLLDCGANVDHKLWRGGEEYYTALRYAIENGDLPMVQLLLERGASPWFNYNDSALLLAIEQGNIDIIKAIISKFHSHNHYKNEQGETGLIYAAKCGRIEAMRILLALPEITYWDCHASDKDGKTALIWAAARGDEDMVKLLLSCSKFTIHFDNERNELDRAILFAVKSKNINVAKSLLDLFHFMYLLLICKEIPKPIRNMHEKALLIAVENNDQAMLEMFSDYGIDKNSLELSNYLLRSGKIAWFESNILSSHLHTLVRDGDIEKVRQLIEYGFQVDTRNHDGCTVLQYAAEQGDLAMVQLLVSLGAEINIQNSSGETAHALAVKKGNLTVAQFLLNQGAAIHV